MERLIFDQQLSFIPSQDISHSRIGIGFEKLDRDVFDPHKAYDKVQRTGVKKVHDALYSLEDYYTNYGVASAKGLINRPVYENEDDAGHFDAPSQRVLGYRYFDIFYNLMTGKSYAYDDDHNSYRKEVSPEPEPEPNPTDYIENKSFDNLNVGEISSIDGLTLNGRDQGFKVYLKSEGGTDKYLSFEYGTGSAANATPYFDKVFSFDGGVVVIEGTFRLSSDFNAAGELFKLLDASNNSLRLVCIDSDGKLYNMCGNSKEKGDELGIHLDQFEWTTVKVVCNLNTNLKDIYCNGQKLGSYAISDSATASFKIAKARIVQLSASSNTGALHLDDFKIYEYTGARYLTNESFDTLELGIAGAVGSISAPSGRGQLNICGKGDSTSDKYLSFELSGATSTPYADVTSTVQQGRVVVIEAKLKLGENFSATGELFKFIDSSSASVRLVWIDSDGKLYNMCDTKAKGDDLGIQLKADAWVTLKVVCDFENNTKSVYLEGELVAEGLPLSASSVSEFEIAKLRLMHCSTASNTGAICFDDFKYYVE